MKKHIAVEIFMNVPLGLHNGMPISGRAGVDSLSTTRSLPAGSVHCIGGLCRGRAAAEYAADHVIKAIRDSLDVAAIVIEEEHGRVIGPIQCTRETEPETVGLFRRERREVLPSNIARDQLPVSQERGDRSPPFFINLPDDQLRLPDLGDPEIGVVRLVVVARADLGNKGTEKGTFKIILDADS